MKLGVVIGRFQVPTLTEAHRSLLSMVATGNDRVIVLLGQSAFKDKRNPLSVATRGWLFLDFGYETWELQDCRTDEEWSRSVDRLLERQYPAADITLYGGRDSFIPHYKGKHRTQTVKPVVSSSAPTVVSGTEVRKQCDLDDDSPQWRAGYISAYQQMYDRVHATVDMVVEHFHDSKVLLIRKHNELQWRFPGGFVDPKLDASTEFSASRELMEETGICIPRSFWTYLGTQRIEDWRTRHSKDKCMTTLYTAKMTTGEVPRAGDDAAEVAWVDAVELLWHADTKLVPEHYDLWRLFENWKSTPRNG